MNPIIFILTIAIHAYTLYDAIISFNKRNGAFRIVLALFPPIIGPLIYFITKPYAVRNRKQKSSFFGNSPFRLR